MNITVVLIFRYFQCLHLMYSEVAWVLISPETQVHPQIILEPDYLPNYLSVFYDYGEYFSCHKKKKIALFKEEFLYRKSFLDIIFYIFDK